MLRERSGSKFIKYIYPEWLSLSFPFLEGSCISNLQRDDLLLTLLDKNHRPPYQHRAERRLAN